MGPFVIIEDVHITSNFVVSILLLLVEGISQLMERKVPTKIALNYKPEPDTVGHEILFFFLRSFLEFIYLFFSLNELVLLIWIGRNDTSFLFVSWLLSGQGHELCVLDFCELLFLLNSSVCVLCS